MFIVRNTNGGILGGYENRKDAEACKSTWENRYKRSPLVNGVDVVIIEQKER